jgi:hypothetical protein
LWPEGFGLEEVSTELSGRSCGEGHSRVYAIGMAQLFLVIGTLLWTLSETTG